jgi:hypothetical protein
MIFESVDKVNNMLLFYPSIIFFSIIPVIYFMSQFQEQKEMISELSYRESKMNRTDYDTFQILVRRQKDDEDFDKESFFKLKEIFDKYAAKKMKFSPKW